MTNTEELQKTPAIARYLSELDAGLSGLPEGEKNSIIADITDHIAAEVEALPADADAHSVELILARLGSPAAIAAEASGAAPRPAPTGFAKFRVSRSYAAMTVLILALGGVLVPILGWITGLVFLWMSNVWQVRHKVVGTLLLPGGFGFLVFLSLAVPPTVVTQGCSDSSAAGAVEQCTTTTDGPPEWFGPTLLAVLVLIQVLSAIYLYRSFSKRVTVVGG